MLPALYLAQHQQGYITANAIRHVAELVGITPADVEDVVSFYTMFYTKPVGKFVLQVCRTLSCALMTIFLLSLGGFPPTSGFIAKWYVFSAAVKAGDYGLAIIGVLTSVVSVFFYLRIVVLMYMSLAEAPARFPRVPRIAGAALVVSAVLVFYLGILPTRVLDWAAASISTIF